MVDIRLPEALRAALEALPVAGREVSRQASALSAAYRSLRPSSVAVAGAADINAYLVARLPATYAAVARVLDESAARLPGFAPQSMLDAGAGPGTASWAAAEVFPGLGAITMLDHNPRLLAIAGDLAVHSDANALAKAEFVSGSLTAPPLGERRFSLVVASYALTELGDRQVVEAALGLWRHCEGVLVVVEPGRPRDYQRLMGIRAALVAAGGRIVAPCPHAAVCPLSADDWCHFSVRLPRSRAHMQAKGGTLGYEDEKFSYLVVARPEVIAHPAVARVLRPPVVSKFAVELALCGQNGLEPRVVQKRDALAFKRARKLEWGDGLD